MKEVLQNLLNEAGVAADERQLSLMNRFYEMLVERNRVMNLTAITDAETAARLHFADSLMLLRYLPLEEAVTIADVGTGAGFPGVPVKIMRPQCHVTLMDSLEKRLNFLEDVILTLDLNAEGGIATVHGRAEDIGRSPSHRGMYDVVLSRAVAALPVLCEYCLPLVKTGGVFVAYKSDAASDEVRDAARAIADTGGRLWEIAEYRLPGAGEGRSLVFIDKVSDTPDRYPRRAGIPAKRPL